MSAPDASDERLAHLHRLTPAEVEVLRRRCGGMTSQEIASALGTTEQVARYLLGNIYDKLGVTYEEGGGTSLSRLTEYCPLLADPSIAQIAAPASLATEPPPLEPSGRALLLVAQDDQSLLAQRSTVPEAEESDNNRRLLYIVGGVLALVLIGGLIFLFASDDEDDDDATGLAVTQTASAGRTATTAAGGDAPDPTATLEPVSAPEPTPTPEPPPPAPEPTPTPEPTATSEPEAPTAPPTETAVPLPQQGDVVYEADWATGPGDWVLPAGWTAQPGMILGDGSTAGSILAPYQPDQPRYAVEADLAIDATDDCDALAGVIGHAAVDEDDASRLTAGYIGAICANEWLILAVRDLSDSHDELASGDAEPGVDQHTYRLEVDGDRVRFFIDGVFAGEATDDRWADPGLAGLFLDGDIRVTVSGFRVYALVAP
ncbi:MAG TPA: LuxR C-terminal-related transcriptional regulator [Thermomicrobiales bacterium]|nr:LuxR C-terminal-related transcriptional regulator [Thermomicrobiales bacterium]